MSLRGLLGLLGALSLLAWPAGAATTATSGGLRLAFEPPAKWVAVADRPAGVLALFRPSGVKRFPHLTVTEGDPGTPTEVLERVRRSLPALFRDLGLKGAEILQEPRLLSGSGPDRVEVAYSGELGEAACDWVQVIVPRADGCLVFTFALPRGTLTQWQGALSAFAGSLKARP